MTKISDYLMLLLAGNPFLISMSFIQKVVFTFYYLNFLFYFKKFLKVVKKKKKKIKSRRFDSIQ